MAITEINLSSPEAPPPAEPEGRRERSRAPDLAPDAHDPHAVPVLLVQLQDDLARSRMREAFWISLVVHMVVIITLLFGPRLLPESKRVLVATPAQLISQRELTYLDLGPDRQKPPVTPPKTNIISDKNRIAASRSPTLDRKELQKILDSSRPGAPGTAGSVPAPPQQAAQAQQPGPQNQQRGDAPQQPATQTAQLQPPPMARGGFGGSVSAGSLIEQAARASAASRGGGAGLGGDYGSLPPSTGKTGSDLEIMSDTMGVDFGPYLSRVLHDVRQNWYLLIPEVARAPLMRKGKVSIEFAILKSGSVAGMKLIFPSGDASLDRAAWGGITGSNPFPPLPSEFRGDYLALRFHFFYNPDKNDLR